MRVREASTAAVLNSRRGPAAVLVVYNARASVCVCVRRARAYRGGRVAGCEVARGALLFHN